MYNGTPEETSKLSINPQLSIPGPAVVNTIRRNSWGHFRLWLTGRHPDFLKNTFMPTHVWQGTLIGHGELFKTMICTPIAPNVIHRFFQRLTLGFKWNIQNSVVFEKEKPAHDKQQ